MLFTEQLNMSAECFVLNPNWWSCVIRCIRRMSSRQISNDLDEAVNIAIRLELCLSLVSPVLYVWRCLSNQLADVHVE